MLPPNGIDLCILPKSRDKQAPDSTTDVTMNEIDRALVDLVARQIPIEKPQRRQLKSASSLGIAILGLVGEPELLEHWYRELVSKKDVTPLESFVSLMVLRDEVADTIDGRLDDGDFDVLNDLVKLGVPWEHDMLPKALQSDDHRFAAAMCLLEIEDFKTLKKFVETQEDVRDVVRAIGLLGAENMASVLAELRSDDDEDVKNGADAALLGVLDPAKYGRKLLAGELETGWLSDSVYVADAFQIAGSPSWLDVLGILDAAQDHEAFEFAALLGMIAACATWQAGGDPDATIDEPESEQDFMTNPRFSIAAGLVPDEELATLAFEVAAHEICMLNETGSPGISGLPLTQTDPDEDVIKTVIALLEEFDPSDDDAVARVEVVRTLCDAATWAVAEPDFIKPLEPLAQKLTGKTYPDSVRGAAQLMLSVMGHDAKVDLGTHLNALTGDIDVNALSALAVGEDVKALCAMRHLSLTAEVEGVEALANAWVHGAVSRGDAFRVALEEAILLMDEENHDA